MSAQSKLSSILVAPRKISAGLVRSMIGSFAAAGAGQASLVVSGIIAARALGPENRGHLALMTLVPTIVTQVGLLGTTNSITYYIARDQSSAGSIMKRSASLMWFQLFLCTLVNAAIIYFLMGDESRNVRIAGLFTLAVPATIILRSYWMAALQGVKAFREFNFLRVVQPLFYALALVVLLIVQFKSLTIIAIAWTITNLATTLVAMRAVRNAVPRSGSATEATPTTGELLRFGAKGFLGTASPLETFRIDQVMVGFFLSPTALGIYVASLAFTTLPRLVALSVGQVAFPHIVSQTDDRSANRYMWRFFWFSLFISLAVVIPLEITAPFIVPFAYGDSFKDAIAPLQILLLGSVIFGARRVLGEGMRGRGYPSANAVAEVASWVWMIPVLAILVPRWDLEGVAIAVVSSALVSLVVLAYFLLASRQVDAQGAPTESSARPQVASPQRAKPSVEFGSRHFIPAVVLIAALGLGWYASASPDSILILAVGTVGLSFAVALRHRVSQLLTRIRASIPTQPLSSVDQQAGDSALSIARLFYYLGAVFLTFISFRPLGVFTISDWFFLGSLLSAIAILIASRNLQFSGMPSGVLIGIGILSAGAFASSVVTSDTIASLAMLFRLVYLTIAWFWLGTIVLKTPRHVAIATVCWLSSAAICGAASMAQLQFGDVIPWTSPIQGRMTGLTQNVNDLGGAMAMAVAPAIMISSILRTRSARVISVAVLLPLIVSGLVLSGSVSGLAAASVGVVVWLALGRVSRNAIVVSALVGVGLFAILTFQQDSGGISPLERLQSSTDSQNQYCTACSREENNRAAWNSIQESPILGEGLTSVTTEGVQVHNLFLGAWFESGILGVIGIMIIVISVANTGIRAIVRARSTEEWILALALTTSFASFLVFAMAQPILFQRYGWIAAGLLVALARQQKQPSIEKAPFHSLQFPTLRPLTSPTLMMQGLRTSQRTGDD